MQVEVSPGIGLLAVNSCYKTTKVIQYKTKQICKSLLYPLPRQILVTLLLWLAL